MEELERSLEDKQEAVRVVEKKSQNMVSGINTGNAWHLHVHVHMQVALPFVWIRFAWAGCPLDLQSVHMYFRILPKRGQIQFQGGGQKHPLAPLK